MGFSSGRVVLHVDMDAFFAAIEERDSPQFNGKPIIVGADPKNGFGRGVVSTANYEARKYGIKSAMPISWAYKACPSAIFLPVNFKRYNEVSESIICQLKSFGYKTEQMSIDEAYIEMTNDKCQMPNYEVAIRLAGEIKKQIKIKEKLTCSVGIGPNKLIAKVASDFKKPNGLTVVEPQNIQKFLDPMSVRVLPGIGPKTAEALNQMGIVTVKDLRGTYLYKLTDRFGVSGNHIWEMAHGKDDRPIEETHTVKSVGRQTTFENDTKDPRIITKTVFELLKETFEDLARPSQTWRGKTLTVIVRYAWFETHSSQTTAEGLLTTANAKRLALKLLLPYLNGKPVRLVGVRISGLEDGLPSVADVAP
ncbi:MAG: DNA polymerase IV [Candidatus Blackburnbacteria bacterium]|nr:DNA polymerase IV [Candidatus Blackburnbacteria bacterium]